MKKITILLVACLSIWAISLSGQTVNVTFMVNTAGVPDTLTEHSLVQIRGGQAPLTWDGSSVTMTNIGGDYWTATVEFPANTSFEYKFFTNSLGDGNGSGWEANVAGNNRQLTTGTTDTTLDLQFVNGFLNGADAMARPYTETDSIDVYFRINMEAYTDYDPSTQVVGIRGAAWPGYLGDLSWNYTLPCVQEGQHANAGQAIYNGTNFWHARARIPKDSVTEGQTIEYKFVIADKTTGDVTTWGSDPNRTFKIPVGKADTTLHWVWWDDAAPVVRDNPDTVVVTWNVDMSEALSTNGFSLGDTLEVRYGFFATASEESGKQMNRVGFSNVYTATDTLVTQVGSNLDYQYYKVKNSQDFREIFYNFDYEGDQVGEQERRMLSPVPDQEAIVINDLEDSNVSLRRMPRFRNTAIVSREVTVTYTCDVRPAIYQVLSGTVLEDIQSGRDVEDADSILAWGVAINGPATGPWQWSNSQGLPDWGSHLMGLEEKAMVDDGTHGDAVAGDSIYTIQFTYRPDSSDVVGQEFKFGIGGGDNEGGKGGYGNNHVENIDDSQSEAVINSQFGSINPSFYDAWDYDLQKPKTTTGVRSAADRANSFILEPNYPNPFNPTTKIVYNLPRESKVKLVVYDILGNKVVELVNEQQNVGLYEVTWDARDQYGSKVSSGVYFYRFEADQYKKSYKMILMK